MCTTRAISTNTTRAKTRLTRTSDGSRRQVQAGKACYLIDENGNYIGTDDPNYDPNRNQGPVTHECNEGRIGN